MTAAVNDRVEDEDVAQELEASALDSLDYQDMEKEDGRRTVGEAGEGIQDAVPTKAVDIPPNGGYGWVCVAACATINA